jgi:hypothetical protein
MTTIMRGLIRPAKRIEASAKEGDVSATSSKFGGVPYLPEGTEWPQCGGCSQPMTFVAQLQLRDTGQELPNGDDFLVFFYCFECLPTDDSPYQDRCWTARTYRNVSVEPARVVTIPDQVRQPVPHAIELVDIASLPTDDYLRFIPEAGPLEELAAQADPDDSRGLYNTLLTSVLGAEPQMSSQVGGYQHGPQGNQSVPDSRFIVQFDSLEPPLENGLVAWGAGAGVVMLFMDKAAPHRIRLRVEPC